tara:strand:- start:30 stop:254 length:225 start_codon:yes stop_codon:yes gene_type:complete
VKIYCISWKDERWSADKEDLKFINKMISKEKKEKVSILSKINPLAIVLFLMYVLGWVYHGLVTSFRWIVSKFKK